MRYRKSILATACTLLLATASAEGLPDELFACRSLDGDAERLACYDGLADRHYGQRGLETSAPDAKAAAAPAAAVENLSQEDIFGLSGDKLKQAYGVAAGRQDLNELSATITDIQPAGYGQIFVWLDNGQVWRQTTSSALKIKVGDRIVIKKGALGSFKMKKEGANVMMRVSREY